MPTDYRQLCLTLFGTDDPAQLARLAAACRAPKPQNPRGAGRKKKFTPADVSAMRALLAQGCTVQQVAGRFNTSRQVVARYLGPAPHPGCTLRMTLLYGRRPCTLIDVDFLHEKIYIQNRTDDLLHRAFGVLEEPTWADFEVFLQSRCFPPTRGGLKAELKALGLTDYDPLQILEKTHGRTAEDALWLKFQYTPLEGGRS